MASRALSILLLVLALPAPLFAQTADPAREFLDGHRAIFSTMGHPKAKGVVFTIAYPRSWAAKEGERPNIVQKFISENGHGLEMALIITKQLPLPADTVLTYQDLRELFDVEMLRGMLPPRATYIGAKSTEIEFTPAGILEYTIQAERAGVAGLMQVWTLNFVYEKTMVQIQFSVVGLAGSQGEISGRMTAFKPLFVLMANSIVFPKKWTDASTPSTGIPASSSASSSLQYPNRVSPDVLLLVSFIVTWSLGLTPALIIRYVFLRRPTSKTTSSLIAAGFSSFFWIAFFVAHFKLGEKPGSGFVWIIMFFIGRWIMSRGYVQALPAEAVPNRNSLEAASADAVAHRR